MLINYIDKPVGVYCGIQLSYLTDRINIKPHNEINIYS